MAATLNLPSTLAPSSLNILTAGSQILASGTGATNVTVLAGSPTVAMLTDTATNSIVGVGVLDPRNDAGTIDVNNLAAATVFMGLGSSQENHAQRIALWEAVVADPAIATLAAVLGPKLAANRFAWRDADADLRDAIQAAIDAVRGNLRPVEKPAISATAKPRSRAVPSPADPPVLYTLPNNTTFGVGQFVSGEVQGKEMPDYLSIFESSLLAPERTLFLIPDATSEGRIAETIAMPEVRGFVEGLEYGPVSIATTSETGANLDYVIVYGIFGAPANDNFLGLLNTTDQTTIREARKLLWKKAVVRFSSDIILDALGYGGYPYNAEQLTQITAGFEAINSEFAAILQASTDGLLLANHVAAFLENASSSEAQVQATYTVLKTVVPELHFLTPQRLIAVQSALRAAIHTTLIQNATTTGRVATAYQWNGETTSIRSNMSDFAPSGLSVQRYSPIIDATASQYTPGGPPIQVNVRSTANDYVAKFDDVLIYKWKVFGSGGVTLSDGTTTSTEFETASAQVIFRSTGAATGAQNIGVEVYLKQGNATRFYGRKTIVLNSSEAGDIQLGSGGATNFGINVNGSLTVSRNGQPITSWPGIESANLRFEWSLANSDAGTYVSNNVPTTSLTTSSSTIPFKSADNAHGTDSTAFVTIKAVDPATGNFTVLASASTILRLHVFSNARVSLTPGFNPADLESQNMVRNGSPIGGNSISFSGGNYFFNGNYSNSGARDRFYVSINLGPNPQVLDLIRFTPTGDNAVVQHTYYFSVAPPGVAINNATGSAEIKEIRLNTNGTPRYIRLRIVSNWTTSTDTFPISSVIDVGVGSYN